MHNGIFMFCDLLNMARALERNKERKKERKRERE